MHCCWQVLILLPMRNQALKVISRLLSLAIKETRSDSVQKKSRFLKEFEDQDEPDESGKLERPAEHVALFQGNTDDYFSLGIKLTRSYNPAHSVPADLQMILRYAGYSILTTDSSGCHELTSTQSYVAPRIGFSLHCT